MEKDKDLDLRVQFRSLRSFLAFCKFGKDAWTRR